MDWKIQLSEMNFDEQEVLAVNEVLKTEWLTMGPKCEEFECLFTRFIGHAQKGIFVSSATAALHLILMALQIGKEHEIIIPGLTFVSDANTVLNMGAKPVFADSISTHDLNVSTESIISKITNKTKAIIVVHFAGFPLDLKELRSVCDSRGIYLIEDCAHSPGAMINGKACGTFGHFSFFSFFSNKNLGIGEGGMVFCEDANFLNNIRLMRSHGMSTVTMDRHRGRATLYDVMNVGLNYRADEIRAAIAIVQLKKLIDGNSKREKIFKTYCSELNDTQIIIPFQMASDDSCELTPSYHIMPVLLPKHLSRDNVIMQLRKSGVQTSVHYPHFASFSAYKQYIDFGSLPIVDQICARELTLPLHPRMQTADASLVSRLLAELV